MMLYIALSVLFLGAAICLGFNQHVPTRALGFVATVTTVAAGMVFVAERLPIPNLDAPPLIWLTLDQTSIYLAPALRPEDRVPAMILIFGGGLALLSLTLTLAPAVRGFGTLFAWALLTIATTLAGLGSSYLLLPFIWSLAVLLGYSVVRSSGALNSDTTLPQGAMLGFLASLVLLGSLLLIQPGLEAGTMPPAAALSGVIIAGLMLVGGVPFHNTFDEAVVAPAALGVLLYGLVFPLLAYATLTHMPEALPGTLPPLWRGGLQVAGVLSLLAGAAGALREHSLRRLLAWQASAQAGMVFLALSLTGPLARLAAPALLANLALTMLAGGLAVTALERLTGSDDYTQMASTARMRVPGLVWGIAGASALGLPPLWGFWGRRWLLDAAVVQANWLVPLVLLASVLVGLAWLGPLVRFWNSHTGSRPVESDELSQLTALRPHDLFVITLAVVPLLVLGVAPELAWDGWLAMLADAPPALPAGLLDRVAGLVLGVLGIGLALVMIRHRSVRRPLSDEDMTPVVLAPDALAQSLAFLFWIGQPSGFAQRLWRGLCRLSDIVATLLLPFEQRFYLAFVLLAVLSVILLMAQ